MPSPPPQLTQRRARLSSSILPHSLACTHSSGQWLEAQGLLVQRRRQEHQADTGLSLSWAPWEGDSFLGTVVRLALCSPGFPEAQTLG